MGVGVMLNLSKHNAGVIKCTQAHHLFLAIIPSKVMQARFLN
jgi:hypothetical protein